MEKGRKERKKERDKGRREGRKNTKGRKTEGEEKSRDLFFK